MIYALKREKEREGGGQCFCISEQNVKKLCFEMRDSRFQDGAIKK